MAKHTKDKKELLCQAAVEVIAREGFHNATIEKIASSAGVAVGTIYNYFNNKNELLDYIFLQEYEKRKRFFLQIKEREMHPLEKLKSIISMHFEEVKKNPDVFIVLLRERGMPRVCHFEGITQFEGLPRFIEEILTEGVDEGALRPCNPGLISSAIFGSIEALMSRYLLELEGKGQSALLDNAAEEMAAILWHGLDNQGHEGRK